MLNNMRLTRIFTFAMIMLLLTACGSTTAEPGTDSNDDTETPAEPTPEPTDDNSDDSDRIDASNNVYVDKLDIMILESFPVQVHALVTGNLADGCVTLDEVKAMADNGNWTIELVASRPAEAMCTEALVPFEETVPLDVAGLPAGTYTITANELTQTFTLDIDNRPADGLGDAIITLERTACFGFCPIYTVTIHEDGTVLYNGINHVEVTGEQQATISASDFAALLEAFESLDYFMLQDNYTNRYVSDMPSTITSLTLNGQTKRIDRYHGDDAAPLGLVELEVLIDNVINSQQWTGVEQTVPTQIGLPNPNGEQTMFVGAAQVDCEGVAPQKCYLVKYRFDAEWEYFYDEIIGFEWEAGYEYELRVSVTELENPPADASALVYELIEVVSKYAVE